MGLRGCPRRRRPAVSSAQLERMMASTQRAKTEGVLYTSLGRLFGGGAFLLQWLELGELLVFVLPSGAIAFIASNDRFYLCLKFCFQFTYPIPQDAPCWPVHQPDHWLRRYSQTDWTGVGSSPPPQPPPTRGGSLQRPPVYRSKLLPGEAARVGDGGPSAFRRTAADTRRRLHRHRLASTIAAGCVRGWPGGSAGGLGGRRARRGGAPSRHPL